MNSLALTPAASGAAARQPRVLAAYLAELHGELLRTMRNPGLAIPILIMPVALYVLIALVVAGEAVDKDPLLGVYLFGAFGIMGVTMPALFAIGAGLALDREMGLLRLKRAQPAPVGAWLVAKIVAGILFGMIAYLPMLAVAVWSGKLSLGAPALVGMSFALLAGSIPFCALGLMVGSLVKGAAAPGYANLIYLPGCYLSGMFFPLPKSMHWQAPFWPQFHVEQVAMHAAGATKFQFMPLQMCVAALVGFTVLFGAVAFWKLSRKG
ncbi:MAG: ABC transporter permease [Steroidobacteraceae bacterium]|nr:ABC transporter permease [Steroidobacteraceae bacterium]